MVDGKGAVIVNGRLLRSQRRYQNKLKGKLSAMIDVKKKGSSRRRRLIKSKRRQLESCVIKSRILTISRPPGWFTRSKTEAWERWLLAMCGIIRDDLDYGKRANQRLHQWTCGESRRMIEYKCERLGMACVLQEESYTSQTCPACGSRHKPRRPGFPV